MNTRILINNLIESDLLETFTIINSRKFEFKLIGVANITLIVKLKYNSSWFNKDTTEKVFITELTIVKPKEQLKFVLFGETDPEEIQDWILTTILKKYKYSPQIVKYVNKTKKKLKRKNFKNKHYLNLYPAEFFNTNGDHWMSAFYDVKPKIQIFLTPKMQGVIPNIEWKFAEQEEIQTTNNLFDLIYDKNQ
jgi:hypothetical protein